MVLAASTHLENDAESDASFAAHAEVWADLRSSSRSRAACSRSATTWRRPWCRRRSRPRRRRRSDAAAFSFALADAVEISAASKQALLEEDSTLLRLMKLGERVSDGPRELYRAQLALRSLSV